MKISPNQPVEFNDENINCQCDGEGSQLIQAGDVTQFQVELEVCNDMPNLILDGDFDAPDSSIYWDANQFTFGSDVATCQTGHNGTLDQYQFGSAQRIAVEVIITELTGSPLIVWFGETKIKEIDRPGTYSLYGVTSELLVLGVANNYIRFESNENNSVSIESVAAYPLEDKFALYLYTNNGSGTLDTPFAKRTLDEDIADPFYTFFRVFENVVTVSFNWDWVTNPGDGLGQDYGCYKLGFTGICSNPCAQLGARDPYFNIVTDPVSLTIPWASLPGATVPTVNKIVGGAFVWEGSTLGLAHSILTDTTLIPCSRDRKSVV